MGRKVQSGVNDLATINPDLASQWHPTKNEDLTPQQVMAGSDLNVWWLGKCEHEWDAPITRRNGPKGGCPICSGKRILAGFNDLNTINPALAAEWHPTKNNELTPTQIASNTRRVIWWVGVCGHEWDARVLDRHSNSQGCPVCCGRRVLIGFNDLSTTNPSLTAQWHPTKNDELTPQQVIAGSEKKVWWLGKCGHEWDATLSNRNKDHGCPVCAGVRVCIGYNDLFTINPILSAEWHPTKNGNLTPQHVIAGGTRKVWWLGTCGHEWNTSVESRARQGLNCPYCSGQRVLSGFNDLLTTNPEIAAQWHPTKNGKQSVDQISKGSKKKVWWQHSSCGHEWDAMVVDRKISQRCPVCTGKRVLVGFNDLGTTHPAIAAEWHSTNNRQLSFLQFSAGSNKKVWWLGASCGHEWNAVIASRGLSGTGCPHCTTRVSKAEHQIKEFLEGLGLEVVSSDRSILNGKEIDLWIPAKNIGIEFNGIYWHSEKWKKRDYHYDKWEASKKAGIQLIQIWENEWFNNPQGVLKAMTSKLVETPRIALSQVIPLSQDQVMRFLQINTHRAFMNGAHYFGVVDKVNTLQAVTVVKSDMDGRSLSLMNFAALGNTTFHFRELLDHLITLFRPESIQAWTDNCYAEENLYEDNGFIVENVLLPSYMYVKQRECELKEEYPIKRFRDDPTLLWEEGLSEMELADLNEMTRIWDAGKSLYLLRLK